jgi:FkbM family methyltransferase
MLIPFEKLPLGSISGIIHVGAHEAEELANYVAAGKDKVLWVEANPSKWSFLSEKLNAYPNMRLGRFAAASSSGGEAILNVASNGQSSSLLPFGSHADNYPSISYTEKILVDLNSVDDWISRLGIDPVDFNFINLDIQGYELNALHGMTNQLQHVDFVYSEVNFEDVYLGCAKIAEMDEFLNDYGLKRVVMVDTGAGWGDAFYSRKSHHGLRTRVSIERILDLNKRLGGNVKRVLRRLSRRS